MQPNFCELNFNEDLIKYTDLMNEDSVYPLKQYY